jgi:hypothetical protein
MQGIRQRFRITTFDPDTVSCTQMKLSEDRAGHFIVVLSPHYLAKPFTLSELYSAVADDPVGEKRVVIPVRVASCEISRLIKDLVFVDFVGRTESECAVALLDAIDPDTKRQMVSFPGEVSTNCRIFIDESYQQSEWYGEPTSEAGYSLIPDAIGEPCCGHRSGFQDERELRDMEVLGRSGRCRAPSGSVVCPNETTDRAFLAMNPLRTSKSTVQLRAPSGLRAIRRKPLFPCHRADEEREPPLRETQGQSGSLRSAPPPLESSGPWRYLQCMDSGCRARAGPASAG